MREQSTLNKDSLYQDLLPFGDVGGSAPKVAVRDSVIQVKMERDGRPLKIVIDEGKGKIQTTHGGMQARSHASLAAMFASEVFANLKRWADVQRDVLQRDANQPLKLIPIRGATHDGKEILSVADVDDLIVATDSEITDDVVRILLLDGPAGIGKTNIIEQVALSRAVNYRTCQKPLLLHVKSRGRVLSNLQDLMAFSLQALRLSITYDQVPVLVKHGLIVLAIDGFDELGDPNGYELAWGQVNELVTSVRGSGVLVLAGRDTFMGRSRLLKDVKSLREGVDIVAAVEMKLPLPEQAKTWLKSNGWSDAHFSLPALSVLLEEDSYALRPVFLRMLGSGDVKPKQLQDKKESYLTPLLVNYMIDRESTKFGKAVEASLSAKEIGGFVGEFLREVARDMADSQTEALDEAALGWLAEAALGDGHSDEVISLVRNRASVVAFLANDERQNYKRFVHSHLMNYFLSHVAIDALRSGDTPKFVRRNLFGTEFLKVFGDVCLQRGEANFEDVDNFWQNASKFPQFHSYADRGIRNAGALLVAALPALQGEQKRLLHNFQIDEAVIRGTATTADFSSVVINQLDVRGADLEYLKFSESSIIRLIADSGTRLPYSFPLPSQLFDGAGQQIDSDLMEQWLAARGRAGDIGKSDQVVSTRLRRHAIYKLLGRACRFRQYWLRDDGDSQAARILNDPNWPLLLPVLREHGFVREEDRPASGRASLFYHLKQTNRLLAEDGADEVVRSFYLQLNEVVANEAARAV